MDFNRAAVFARVVEAGGFSAAARQLGMPKTTVSKKVAELEGELGVRLLNRTTRRVAPTEAGQRLYRHCADAIRRLGEGEREARSSQRAPRGLLTVAAPGAIAVNFLLPTIIRFLDAYPDVQISLLSVNDVAEPLDDGVDVLIWAGPATPRGHTVRLVARVELAHYASGTYVQRTGAPKTPSDLAGHDVVAFAQSFRANRFTWRLHKGGEEVEIVPARPPRFRSDDPAAVLGAIAAGLGVGVLPIRFAEQVGAGRDLVGILPAWRAPASEVRALVADTSSLKTRLFLDHVAEWFRRA